MASSKGIWISWETHTRSRSLSKALGTPLHEIAIKGSLFKRYLVSLYRTYVVLKDSSADVIFFQNPSIVLSFFLVVTRSLHKKSLVMDAHNAGLNPLEGKSKTLVAIARWIVKRVDLTIVTNETLAEEVQSLSGSPFVLTDPIPSEMHRKRSRDDSGTSNPYVLFICTWASDEPYYEVLEAAGFLLSEGIRIHFTGKPPRDVISLKKSANVILEGFVSHQKYVELISDAALIVDLTTRDDCLVCGAYEAAAVERPCVLSDTRALQETFTRGYVFTKNEASDIAESIRAGLKNSRQLSADIATFREEYSQRINVKINQLSSELRLASLRM